MKFKSDKQRKAVMMKLNGSLPNKKYTTNYLGSKQKFVNKIINDTPENADKVIDGFAGSNIVGYEWKKTGREVTSVDKLHYSHHIAKAIIENNKTKLEEKDLERLFKRKSKRTHFMKNSYSGTFYTPEILDEMDSIRYNANDLDGYKKNIALAALGKTALNYQAFSRFTVTNGSKSSKDERIKKLLRGGAEGFRKTFKEKVDEINSFVFDNGRKNKAVLGDITKIKDNAADLAYYDPPYITQFSSTDYEQNYHLLEALMRNGSGITIDSDKKTKTFKEAGQGLGKNNIDEFFNSFLSTTKAKKVILSYRDKSFPNESKIKSILKENDFKIDKIRTINHQYQTSSKRTENSQAKEYLFEAKK